MYDFLIVGAGLFGSTFAYEAAKRGKKCLVIDRRSHIGGNIYTHNIQEINVHQYGAHIFHTKNRAIWEYINQFADFNNYVNSPLARVNDETYNLPFNMNTFSRLWHIFTPAEALEIINAQKVSYDHEPANLEEQALSLVGKDLYYKLVKGYTEKQWGRPCSELPADIIRRLPVRFTYDNNYFNDPFQGIPIGGYTQIIAKMLSCCDVELNCDFFKKYRDFKKIADKLIFTGMIDEYYDYCFGHLEYRSLKFKTRIENTANYQGVAVINYTGTEVPYTRVIEHKHFEYGTQTKTVITEEYPVRWEPGEEAYYPINDSKNNELYLKYKQLSESDPDVIFGGRLGTYHYWDMDTVLSSCLELVNKILN
ncbi:UDP-galactopyranose mutase [Candidatus Methanomassiliicoccus intestinalis]|uniref:UDP-galactopyranose mutase n=1 Tax=Candidatus Methanomassiliicoccus intestinalis TaxID=1406512 RepID=UPI0037DD3D49